MSSTKSAERWGEAGSRRNSVQGVGGGCCSRARLKRRRGNFSTSSSSTRMLLHARRTRKLPSLSLALETRLRIVGCLKAILLIVLPDTPVIFSLVSALEGLLLSLSFRSRGEENGGFFRERIDELYGGGGEFGFDSFGRRRLWKARSFNRILKGSLIWVSRV